MALLIRTTGLEQYAPGGDARIKVLTIGGPGAGKTRWASYFPAPIYADCEAGLASVADRQVPFVTISTSEDMLDLLAHLKQECRQPAAQRAYQTVVIDTLDAFQRKVKDEWMIKEKKQTFTGWEAWGYLNSKMQLLMTRLLNLDMNVVVNAHFKDKTSTDDETGKSTHTLALQLQGELSDTAFNDFDLVGWMGTYWAPKDGERVQKRGITFRPTPEKPFLKDRLHVTPDWLEVEFADSDYTSLFEAVNARVETMKAGAVIGEVPAAGPDEGRTPSQFVMAPGALGSGAVAPLQPKDVPLIQLDKPGLMKMCRDNGVRTTTDGTPIRSNTNKGELIAALEAHFASDSETTTVPVTAAPETTPDPKPAPSKARVDEAAEALKRMTHGPDPIANPARVKQVPEGLVNTETGELEATPEQAVETVKEVLGATVISEPTPPAPTPPAAPPAVVEPLTCAECGKDLTDENPDIVKLSYIRFRKRLCETHYAEAKAKR
jgi:hypothetical protein